MNVIRANPIITDRVMAPPTTAQAGRPAGRPRPPALDGHGRLVGGRHQLHAHTVPHRLLPLRGGLAGAFPSRRFLRPPPCNTTQHIRIYGWPKVIGGRYNGSEDGEERRCKLD